MRGFDTAGHIHWWAARVRTSTFPSISQITNITPNPLLIPHLLPTKQSKKTPLPLTPHSLPTYSIYCASKWAIEGFTEAISQEVKPAWNIHFTLIEPGGFRTDIAGRSMEYAAHRLPAYEHIDAKENNRLLHGNEDGDPIKGAKAMYELAIMENPPLRVVLGRAAYGMVMEKLERDREGYKRFETLSHSTEVYGYRLSRRGEEVRK